MINFDKVREQIETKWGKLEKVGHYYANGKMPFVSKDARLNVLFDPLSDDDIKELEDELGAKLPAELKAIYKVTNGVRLFYGSLNIFGYQIHSEDTFEAYDLLNENIRIADATKDVWTPFDDFFLIGSLGGDYMFAMKRSELSKVYTIPRIGNEILQTFDSIEDMFNHYFDALIDEYNDNCEKIHRNGKYKDVRGIQHLSNEII